MVKITMQFKTQEVRDAFLEAFTENGTLKWEKLTGGMASRQYSKGEDIPVRVRDYKPRYIYMEGAAVIPDAVLKHVSGALGSLVITDQYTDGAVTRTVASDGVRLSGI